MLFRQEYIKGSAENRHRTGKSTWRDQSGIKKRQIIDCDGTTEVIATDESWHTATGPYTYNNIYSGDKYDATLEENGWKMQYAKNFPTRIALMYAECIRKSE